MKYSNVIIETKGGRKISILKDISLDPNDVDYVILYEDIPEFYRNVCEMRNDGSLLNKHIDKLIELGLMRKI